MSVRRSSRCYVMMVVVGLAGTGQASAQPFPASLSPAEAAEARALAAAMKGDERGPYLRIRWFCADGSVHAPQGTPCRERGGGVQHAEHSPAAKQLAEMGIHVGTILQSVSFEDFVDRSRSGYRLREMVLERHLFQADDGWVLRRARYYRGALQIEDEERAGRALMEQLLSDDRFLETEYFLASRLALSIPHARVGSGPSMDRIRELASEVAELDPGFMRIRIKIHSVPSPDDVGTVEAYLRDRARASEVRSRLESLRDLLSAQYDPQAALTALAEYRRSLGPRLAPALTDLEATLAEGTPGDALAELSRVAQLVRREAEGPENIGHRLDLLDLGTSLHERAFVLAQKLPPPLSRRAALERFGQYTNMAYGVGYLSGRERATLEDAARELAARESMGALDYKMAVAYLSRALDWGRGTVLGTFQPVLDHYAPVEPAVSEFPDAVLRGSVLLPLSRVLDQLQSDADAALGANHVILGTTMSHGVRGLNPGVALRTLQMLEPGGEDEVDANTIYVLPETPPELKPVAGVLTLAEGNLLSHVQLLARNLGIPNASLAPDMRERLASASGREVFFAVTPLGRVILKWPSDLDEDERSLVETGEAAQPTRHRLDVSRLRLDRTEPIPLSELRAEHSGVWVGPKAANLGQLATDFPGRVSRGVALPFGMFLRHVDRPFAASRLTVIGELRAAYAHAAEMRTAGASPADVDAYMLERLAWVRQAIEGLKWLPDLRTQVTRALAATLGGDIGKGVFVRSDTNVEDLPQFSGAGLNLTVAHQTSVDDVLAAIKRVWTSPFSERAFLWRSQILEEQGDVYPSVLLQESIPSEHSGVLITSGLQEGGPDDVTVVAAEGVGGAVDGGEAETLLLEPGGGVRLLSQAKAPRRRELTAGGTRWVAARRPETLLQPEELAQLRDVVATWKAKQADTPDEDTIWDMEFGFVAGRLWLFQVRPFVRFQNSDIRLKLEALDRGALANAEQPVLLSGTLENSG